VDDTADDGSAPGRNDQAGILTVYRTDISRAMQPGGCVRVRRWRRNGSPYCSAYGRACLLLTCSYQPAGSCFATFTCALRDALPLTLPTTSQHLWARLRLRHHARAYTARFHLPATYYPLRHGRTCLAGQGRTPARRRWRYKAPLQHRPLRDATPQHLLFLTPFLALPAARLTTSTPFPTLHHRTPGWRTCDARHWRGHNRTGCRTSDSFYEQGAPLVPALPGTTSWRPRWRRNATRSCMRYTRGFTEQTCFCAANFSIPGGTEGAASAVARRMGGRATKKKDGGRQVANGRRALLVLPIDGGARRFTMPSRQVAASWRIQPRYSSP